MDWVTEEGDSEGDQPYPPFDRLLLSDWLMFYDTKGV